MDLHRAYSLLEALDLEAPSPQGTTPLEILEWADDLRKWGDTLFAHRHNSYQAPFKTWVKAVDDFNAVAGSKNAPEAKVEAALAKKEAANDVRLTAFHGLMVARAGEEVARYLTAMVSADLNGDQATVESLERRLEGTYAWTKGYFSL